MQTIRIYKNKLYIYIIFCQNCHLNLYNIYIKLIKTIQYTGLKLK